MDQEAAEDGVLGPKMTEETTFKSTWERSTPYVLWQRKGNSPDHVTSYKLYFSIDGVNWMVYTELNKMKVKKKHLTDFTITENERTQYKVQTPCTTCN